MRGPIEESEGKMRRMFAGRSIQRQRDYRCGWLPQRELLLEGEAYNKISISIMEGREGRDGSDFNASRLPPEPALPGLIARDRAESERHQRGQRVLLS